ncbi:uncharacterized protein LAJ45_08900 [Morchella importuna]|uniref:uncharacterized protein n=1 Tax=Morchella importuna TaxID=1174673 RepID=UPI001E8D886A|nr:uncharacterized protein LAJ45_08900 [Morchella importuna]KAH8147100.1 hypothetical protein LAJ45_08900 [Morchella importuna]
MCKFNQEIHVCGHITYALHSACPNHTQARSLTGQSTCSLIPTTTHFVPSSFIHQTTTLLDTSCSSPSCFYTVESDPFHCDAPKIPKTTPAGPALPPSIPSFSIPINLSPAGGPSLFDELLIVDPTLSFVESIQLELHSPVGGALGSRKTHPMRAGRAGTGGDMTPRGAGGYQKLSRHMVERRSTRVCYSGSPVSVRAKRLCDIARTGGKRKRVLGGRYVKRRRVAVSKGDEEALTCGFEALSFQEEEEEEYELPMELVV